MKDSTTRRTLLVTIGLLLGMAGGIAIGIVVAGADDGPTRTTSRLPSCANPNPEIVALDDTLDITVGDRRTVNVDVSGNDTYRVPVRTEIVDRRSVPHGVDVRISGGRVSVRAPSDYRGPEEFTVTLRHSDASRMPARCRWPGPDPRVDGRLDDWSSTSTLAVHVDRLQGRGGAR